MITALLNAGANLDARSNRLLLTPLHLAVDSESVAVVQVLLAFGAAADPRDTFGGTPLHWAAYRTSPALIMALLDAGADPKARNKKGEIPWDNAQKNKALKGTDAYWRLNDARFE